MSFEPRDFLQHILAEADYLETVNAGLTRERLGADATLQRAVVRSLAIIGEASKRVPAAFRDAHPQVEWRAMSGMRDRLIHDYFGVDLDIVWDVLQTKIAPLRAALRRILDDG
jgi:uncharacterized protein with HEPN domain